MPDHLNEDELKQVTGGEISYANALGADSFSGRSRYNNKAVCIDCGETYIGLAGEIQEKINKHLSITKHSYFYFPE